MQLSDFDYELPTELIAQRPTPERTDSRMLVLPRANGECRLTAFRTFPDLVEPGDCLVLNDTRVIPARLFGRRQPGGGRVEVLLVEQTGTTTWRCMLRPGRRLRVGESVVLADAPRRHLIIHGRGTEGMFEVEFDFDDVEAFLDKHGSIPLPPYIRRAADDRDRTRYQTVYARNPGAVAAPTAGLHFSEEVLARLAAKGVGVVRVTLHVGPGTFRPVQSEDIDGHIMHEERFAVTARAAARINAARDCGGRVVAVGTTSVRVLETCFDDQSGRVRAGEGRTRLFLRPPLVPKATDALLTNFHLPRSTLLMLVSTFSSVDRVLAAYRLAVRERMRFYSYGDCMLVV